MFIEDSKIGDKVRCIKKPENGHYQCEVGDIFTIREIERNILYFKEHYDESYKCFNPKLFEPYVEDVVKQIYNFM